MKKEEKFRNFVDYPAQGSRFIEYPIKPIKRPTKPPVRNCIGMNATGDDTTPVPVTVTNVTALNYVKTAFAIVGIFVVGKYLYGKLK